MSAYEIKVSITPLCPSCGKESHSGGFVAESRAPQGVFDRDNPTERTDQRVFIAPCNDCFVHRAAVADLIEAGAAYAEIVASSDDWTGDEQRYFAQMAGAEPDSSRWVVIQIAQSRFESALARVKGGAR